MITSRQVRAARALLGWTQEMLADKALVALTALKRLESERLKVRDYDRQHLALYARLLDAADEGAEWTEVVRVLFGLDPNRERERAHRVHDSHLARARWMTEHGYRDLLRSAMH
jgi:transcriptional regulator with XRE-family HTH domain